MGRKPRWAEADAEMSKLSRAERERFLRNLCRENECAESLILSTRLSLADLEQLEEVRSFLATHNRDCNRQCLKNVQIARDTNPDSRKRWGYGVIAERSMIAWIEQHGGSHTVRTTPKGKLDITRFPQDPNLPFPPPYFLIETFEPTDPSQPGHVTLEVDSQELFEKPGPVLQSLDVLGTKGVKSYEAEGGPLHWNKLTSEDDSPLRIRWKGVERPLAAGWKLYTRYAALLRKHRERPQFKNDGPLRDDRQGLNADAVLMLRDLALRYDGRSWFAGFAARTLDFRQKDKYRAEQRDPMSQAKSLSPSDQSTDDRTALDETSLIDESVATESERVAQIDKDRKLSALRSRLTDQQRKILKMRSEGVAVQDIAGTLQIRRETVSRHLTRIKEIAARID